MTNEILEQVVKAVKFSDLKTGRTAWAIIAGKPTEVRKTESTVWGAMMSNARRVGGRNGKTYVKGDSDVFETEQDCRKAFEAKCRERRQMVEQEPTAKEDTISRQAQGHRRIVESDRAFREWCNTDSDAGRAYVLAAAGAGRVAATADSKLHARQQQARKYQDSPEVAALKARVKAELGLGG